MKFLRVFPFLLLLFAGGLSAENPFSCHGQLNVSLDPESCETALTPQMLITENLPDYSNMVVLVDGDNSNIVTAAMIGQLVPVMVLNTDTGQSCWSDILVEDKDGPVFINCADLTISCLEQAAIPPVSAEDCTAVADFSVQESTTTNDCGSPFAQTIVRTYTAFDANGMSSTCTQTINLTTPDLSELACPADVTLECLNGQIPSTEPDNTGYPTLTENGISYELTPDLAAACMLMVFKNDVLLDKCGIGEKYLRQWTVMDMCGDPNAPGGSFTCLQVVLLEDNTAPEIVAPADITVSTSSTHCFATFEVPPAQVSDCSDFEVVVATPTGFIAGNGGTIPAPGLESGVYTLVYTATDDCGNAASDNLVVTVIDENSPTIVCDDDIEIVLNETGGATLSADIFVLSATDNCCTSFNYTVARLENNCGNPSDLIPGSSVSFCCADEEVAVVVTVTDCNGNSSQCFVDVTVVGEDEPFIVCPPDVTLDCGEDFNDSDLVGEIVTNPSAQGPQDGLAGSACGSVIVTVFVDADLNDCGAGTVTRTFNAIGTSGSVSCTQTITLVDPTPFSCSEVQFPDDVDLTNCVFDTDALDLGMPILPTTDCSMLSVAMVETTIEPGTNGACRDIVRTWTVTDACQPGLLCSDTQTIRIFDTTIPVLSGCDNRAFCTDDENCFEEMVDLSVTVEDDCLPTDEIALNWSVDLNDDGSTDFTGTGQNIQNTYPVGTHRIFYTAVDLCGNTATCSFRFFVEDCGKPQIDCSELFVVELDENGQLELDINELNLAAVSSDNCSPASELIFSFTADESDQLLNFDCSDLGTNMVTFFATDINGFKGFCEGAILVSDPNNACGAGLMISGQITTPAGTGLPETTVQLDQQLTTTTNTAGGYTFLGVAPTTAQVVTPTRDTDIRQGVTTLDLIHIKRHLLGTVPFTSPHQYLAADANNSEAVTALDIVRIRQIILHIDHEFPNNQPWRFVDANYTFPDPHNPWLEDFPESCVVDPAQGQPVDFVAIKVGDVTGAAGLLEEEEEE